MGQRSRFHLISVSSPQNWQKQHCPCSLQWVRPLLCCRFFHCRCNVNTWFSRVPLFERIYPDLNRMHGFVHIVFILLHSWCASVFVMLTGSIMHTLHFTAGLQDVHLSWAVRFQLWTAPRLRLIPTIPPFVFESLFIVCSIVWSTGTCANALRWTANCPSTSNALE